METELTNGLLHSTILQFIIDRGFGPSAAELALALGTSEDAVSKALAALQDYHGVVLHPNSNRIWVIHPFSLAPTSFVVRTDDRVYWGNCAWCSLGVAALLDRDVTISTVLGADKQQVEIHIRNGELMEPGYVVHFPIPMAQAWDNVTYTCSTMLMFDSAQDVERWCGQHRIAQGDIQPLGNVWEFARTWYGNHLNPRWEKWNNQQALAIFERFGLTHPVWQIAPSQARF